MTLRCQREYPVCGYKYNPANGDPEHNIAPGTPLSGLLKNWACTKCVAETGEISDSLYGGDPHERCI